MPKEESLIALQPTETMTTNSISQFIYFLIRKRKKFMRLLALHLPKIRQEIFSYFDGHRRIERPLLKPQAFIQEKCIKIQRHTLQLAFHIINYLLDRTILLKSIANLHYQFPYPIFSQQTQLKQGGLSTCSAILSDFNNQRLRSNTSFGIRRRSNPSKFGKQQKVGAGRASELITLIEKESEVDLSICGGDTELKGPRRISEAPSKINFLGTNKYQGWCLHKQFWRLKQRGNQQSCKNKKAERQKLQRFVQNI